MELGISEESKWNEEFEFIQTVPASRGLSRVSSLRYLCFLLFSWRFPLKCNSPICSQAARILECADLSALLHGGTCPGICLAGSAVACICGPNAGYGHLLSPSLSSIPNGGEGAREGGRGGTFEIELHSAKQVLVAPRRATSRPTKKRRQVGALQINCGLGDARNFGKSATQAVMLVEALCESV